MNDQIEALITRVIEREGGYVNHPADAGGPTRYGITLAALHDWRRAPVGAADADHLATARPVARRHVRRIPRCGRLSAPSGSFGPAGCDRGGAPGSPFGVGRWRSCV